MEERKSCFVIIGFGPKPDPETGRIIDLDKTYENLIKPVFTELNIDCFRAKEIRHTGNIDVPMYEWIFKADIVVADISTLNANAMYELGVRHALRPNTTIVISEDQTKYPFDLSHTVITKYEHLGKDIGVSEANRFKQELKETIIEVLKNESKDSPVYTFLPKLKPPKFEDDLEVEISKQIGPSFSDLINKAEDAKNENEFKVAIHFFKLCLDFEPQNSFLIQRLALVTYKYAKPSKKEALLRAIDILEQLNPEETTDIETLGLSGAINKRLYEITNDESFLDKGIHFYAKGFYIAQDYYNGINYSFLLTIKAAAQIDNFETISFFRQSQRIREEIIKICLELIDSKNFNDRGDRVWIYQSLAQAYLGLDSIQDLGNILVKIEGLSNGKFDLDTFIEQNKKLVDAIKKINKKIKT